MPTNNIFDFSTNTIVSSNKAEFVLKDGISDITDKSSELKRFIEQNEEIDSKNVGDDQWWYYLNPSSNKNYFRFYKNFFDENFSIYSSILSYTRKKLKYKNDNTLKIALVGGGNLSELVALNYYLKKDGSGIRLDVDVIDKFIWPLNCYKSNDINHLNKVTLILSDFFDELNAQKKYDAIIFSRVTNYTEFHNYKANWDEITYIRNFRKLVRPYVGSKTNVVILDFNYDSSEAHEFTKKFALRFFNYLNKAYKYSSSLKYKTRCIYLISAKSSF
ncbi:MAG: hypothetical protein MJ206_02240 [Bacilli bacterium]|nr:hypothetical protein [Bacilli bacterium]